MKVEIFNETSDFELECAVNDFIEDKKVKQISYSTYMSDETVFYSCMILYEDNDNY